MRDTLGRQPWRGLLTIALFLFLWYVVFPLFYGDPMTVPPRGKLIAVVIGYGIGVTLFELLPQLVRRVHRDQCIAQ